MAELVRYPFALKDRVKGPGILGVVIDRPGPYSVTIQQDRGRQTITAAVTDLEPAE